MSRPDTAGLAKKCARPTCPSRAHGELCEEHRRQRHAARALRGDFDPVDAEPIRRRLVACRNRGWSWVKLSPLAHMSTARVIRLHDGIDVTLARWQAAQIMAIVPTWQRSRVSVSSVGTRRRKEALAYQGWPIRVYAGECGVSQWTVLHSVRRATLGAGVAAAIAEFYDAHAHLAGPNPRLAATARNRGARSWGAWTEDTIDDPFAQPIGVRGWRRDSDALLQRFDPAEIAGLVEGGRSIARLSEDFGFAQETLRRAVRVYREQQRTEQQRAQRQSKEAA